MSIASILPAEASWFKNRAIDMMLALGVIILAVSNSQAQSQSMPASWQKVEACGVAFFLPPDMKPLHKGLLGLDRCVEWFANDTMQLAVETDAFGFLSSKQTVTNFRNLAGKPNFTRTKTKIAARKAVIASYEEPNAVEGFRYQSAMSISTKGGLKMFASMKTAADQNGAERIFRSVTVAPEVKVSSGRPSKQAP